jgi:hypothetical protein
VRQLLADARVGAGDYLRARGISNADGTLEAVVWAVSTSPEWLRDVHAQAVEARCDEVRHGVGAR